MRPVDDRGHDGLIAWQWRLYSSNHTLRPTLVVHLITVPLVWLATAAVLVSPMLGWPAAVTGPIVIGACIALQGRTHRLEPTPPVPFRGVGDAVRRLLAEQFIAFPRYVLTGGLARAWRQRGADVTSTS